MKRVIVYATAVFLVAALVSGVALANGGPERLRRVMGAGGTSASAGDLTLHGTLGQPVVGSVTGDAGVVLVQGFWSGGGGTEYFVYLPLILR